MCAHWNYEEEANNDVKKRKFGEFRTKKLRMRRNTTGKLLLSRNEDIKEENEK